jgi:hypothetical protein
VTTDTAIYCNEAAPRRGSVLTGESLWEPASREKMILSSSSFLIVGNSPTMVEVFEQVRRFAACDLLQRYH